MTCRDRKRTYAGACTEVDVVGVDGALSIVIVVDEVRVAARIHVRSAKGEGLGLLLVAAALSELGVGVGGGKGTDTEHGDEERDFAEHCFCWFGVRSAFGYDVGRW